MYIFGPVPSRRLGQSLGIDLVTHKTCTLNCIYCECGTTTNLTNKRQSFVSLKNVLLELDSVLETKPSLDYITFSGSGEPTLSTDIGKVIRHIKIHYPEYKIALLTSGTLLKDKTLREDLLEIDLIIPSVDAISEDIFQKINCPHNSFSARDITDGILEFKKEFRGEIWIEVFIIPDFNDHADEMQKIKDYCLQLKPDRVQLNTLDRPAPHNILLTPVSIKKLFELKEFLSPLEVDIITHLKQVRHNVLEQDINRSTAEKIINFLKRRPATTKDLAGSLNLKIVEINKFLREMEENKTICSKDESRGKFYYIK